VERARLPPGAKKSWRLGRFSGGAGVIEMGAEVDIRGCCDPMIAAPSEEASSRHGLILSR